MINLKEYYLCDLYEMSSGISTTPKQAGHGSPFVSFGCIYNNTILPEELRDMMDTSLEEQEKYSVKEGDIFITRTSETLDELAMSSVAIKDYPGATFSGFAKRLRPLQNNITYAKFMAYFLRSDYFRKIVNCKAVMTLRASFNEEIFSYIKVKLPEYEHQVKCGDFFWTIEEKIRCNKKIISELELLAKTIYDYWFLQYDFPDENGKPYKSSGGEMVWNEELKREIPVGWEVFPIGKLFTTNRGVSYNSATLEGKGIPMVNLASFTPTGAYKIDGIKNYSGDYTEDKVLKPYDLVMCNTQQTAIDYSKDIIGRALLVPDIFEGNIVSSHHVNTIRTVDEALKFHLYYLFNSDYFHKYVTGYANGTNIMGLVFEGVEKYISEIPEKRVLQEFAKLSLSIEKKKSEIIRENQELISLRDFLLPLLMNGQIGFRNVAISNKE